LDSLRNSPREITVVKEWAVSFILPQKLSIEILTTIKPMYGVLQLLLTAWYATTFHSPARTSKRCSRISRRQTSNKN